MYRICLACSKQPAATIEKYPALCRSCLARVGQNITPGATVICETAHNCSGIVDRLADEMLVVVRTSDGGEAWVPRVELVRVV